MKKFVFIFILSLAAVTATAGLTNAEKKEYKEINKSGTYEQKYDLALKLYQKEEYKKVITLLEDVQSAYRGTETAQHIMYYLSVSYIKRKDYDSAIHYLGTYLATYLRGQYLEECSYMLAYCHYKLSPEYELDQTETEAAIDQLEKCLIQYPFNEKAADAKTMLAEMKDKLAKRELSNATLYYNLGNYRGNNYRAAVVTAMNAMNDYPDCAYIEDFAFIIVKAKYKETIESHAEKLGERAEDSWDECYYFLNEYPETKHRKEVEKMAAHLKKIQEAQKAPKKQKEKK